MLRGIPCTLMRGGTSKALFFHARDLPAAVAARDRVLLAAMGSPDARQIDGVGGAHPLTSKVAIISPSARADADVDYLFLQVVVDKAEVSDSQNCGNILAGVGPWAIENGLVSGRGRAHAGAHPHGQHRQHRRGAGARRPRGAVEYEGDARIDGVPGTRGGHSHRFPRRRRASSCGALLPDRRQPSIACDGIEVTCIDNGMPVVLHARRRPRQERRRNTRGAGGRSRRSRRASSGIRLALGPRMNLGDVAKKTVPKMCLVSPAAARRRDRHAHLHPASRARGHRRARRGQRRHRLRHAGLGGRAGGAASPRARGCRRLEIEHPTGFFTVEMDVTRERQQRDGEPLRAAAHRAQADAGRRCSSRRSAWSGP